jgi:4'-phosphopantetheinyl transferase
VQTAPGSVHLWHADPGAFATPDARRACLDLLDDVETARLGHLRLDVDRMAYLVAHALLRSALSVRAAADLRTWRFVAGQHGKPQVGSPAAHRNVSFSLSHARSRAVVAVAVGREVGVDVEDAARGGALEDLADRFLSSSEIQAMRALPPEGRRDRLLTCWTLKEAYLKARGTGLLLPLTSVAFHLDDGPVRATFDPAIVDDPGGWAFFRFTLGPGEPAALAIRLQGGEEPPVFVHEVRALPRPS